MDELRGAAPYVIKARHGWWREWRSHAIFAGAFGVLGIGGVLLFGDFDDGFDRFMTLAGICFVVVFYAGVSLLNAISEYRPDLVVERPGVRLGGVPVPWPSIRQIVVLAPDGARGSAEIGLRLRFGAPLPSEMEYVIYDPGDPDALHVRHRLRAGRLDTARFDAAVRAFAPPDVRVVGDDPGRADRPPPTVAGERRDAPATVLDVRMHDHGGSRPGNMHVYKPYPVVGFTLPDGRQVIAETGRPGQGEPGAQVMVSYDAGDPADVWVHGGKPKSIRRFTPMSHR